jgi:hypothetical protein
MPIIETADADSPLTQGDVLQGATLAATAKPYDRGELIQTAHRYCLVISRPCVCAHKRYVVVAAVAKYDSALPADFEKTIDNAIDWLTSARDGRDAPDRFYLGQIEGQTGRFCALLDSLHTIELPEAQAERQDVVRRTRIGRLSRDFANDLHVRIFASYSRLGFDDHRWMSDVDLGWLIGIGQAEIAKVNAARLDLKADYETKDSALTWRNPKEKEAIERQIANLEKDLARLQDRLRPYESEQTSRRAAPPSP